MVSNLPTFRSERVTQVPSMGIVNMSGDRAMAQAMQGVGKVFDQLGDFANRKLNEQMEREQTLAGIEIALGKGFDPMTLGDPVTAADRIFRESALNTYGIELQQNISNEINRLYFANQRNPKGFANAASAYVEQTVSSLPTELKTGASKIAMSLASQRHFSLLQDHQRRVVAETEAAEAHHLSGLRDRLTLAKSPEERQTIMAEVEQAFQRSTQFVTGEGRQAAYEQFVDSTYEQDIIHSVTKGNMTALQAINEFEKAGIVVDNQKRNEIYSASNQRLNYIDAALNRRENNRKRLVTEVERTYASVFFDLRESGSDPDLFDEVQRKASNDLRQSGATANEIIEFRKDMARMFHGDPKDDPSAILALDAMVFDPSPNDMDRLNDIYRRALITPQTYQKYTEKMTKADADIMKNPQVQQFVQRYVNEYAPLANRASPGWELLYSGPDQVQMKQRIADHARRKDDIEDRIRNNFLEGERSVGAILSEINSDVRANQAPVPAQERAAVSIGSPVYSQMQDLLRAPDFTLRYATEQRSLQSVTHNDDYEFREVLKGPWSGDNYRKRLQLMQEQNRRAQTLGIMQPYDTELLRELYNAFE